MTIFGGIIFLVLAVIVAAGTIFSVCTDFRTENLFIKVFFSVLGVILTEFCYIILFALVMDLSYPMEEEYTRLSNEDLERKEIVMLDHQNSILDICDLKDGKTDEVYRFYTKDNDVYTLNTVDKEYFKIEYLSDTITPYVEYYDSIYIAPKHCKFLFKTENHRLLTPLQWRGTIYIPEDSNVQQYKLKIYE